MVEHIHGKDEVTGSIPVSGSKVLDNKFIRKLNNMATKNKENLVKLKCIECKSITYYTSRNKKKIKEKLELKKHCPKCKTHTLHKEMK